MKIQDILEATTKHGKEITFKRVEDSEGDMNRGWQVDKLIALIDGDEVGYLKMSYIPTERYHQHFPTILHWLDKMKGKPIFSFSRFDPPTTRNWRELSRDELIKVWRQAYTAISGNHPEWHDREKYFPKGFGSELHLNGTPISSVTKDVLIREIAKLEEAAWKEFGKEFRQFKKFHVDKPIVDYIRVNEKFQRQRIGEALYREGAKWMAEKNMRLYASGIQTQQAKGAWEFLSKAGIVGKDRRGRYVEPHHKSPK